MPLKYHLAVCFWWEYSFPFPFLNSPTKGISLLGEFFLVCFYMHTEFAPQWCRNSTVEWHYGAFCSLFALCMLTQEHNWWSWCDLLAFLLGLPFKLYVVKASGDCLILSLFLLALSLLANLRCKQTKCEQNLCSHAWEFVKMTPIWPLHWHLFFTLNPVTAVLAVPNFDGAPATMKEWHILLKRKSLTDQANKEQKFSFLHNASLVSKVFPEYFLRIL